MLKKILTIIALLLVLHISNFANAGMWLGNMTTIYNPDITKVIDTNFNGSEITNPLNDWAYWVVKWDWGAWEIEWLVWTEYEITEHSDALGKILKVIQNVVNYALLILGTVALIYLIAHGFIILTAAGDDSKVKKWFKWIKNAFVAIAWIGLSRLIISFLLRLINTIAG